MLMEGINNDQVSQQMSNTKNLWFNVLLTPSKLTYAPLFCLCLGYICLPTSMQCLYDVQITVSLCPPQGDLAIIVQIYGHCGLYGFV